MNAFLLWKISSVQIFCTWKKFGWKWTLRKDWHTLSPHNKGSKFQEFIISNRENTRVFLIENEISEKNVFLGCVSILKILTENIFDEQLEIHNCLNLRNQNPNFERFRQRSVLRQRILRGLNTFTKWCILSI